MQKKCYIIGILLLAGAMGVACDDDALPQSLPTEAMPLQFAPAVEQELTPDAATTRGVPVTTVADFGVLCCKSAAFNPATDKPSYIHNKKVVKQATLWAFEQPQYWPSEGKLSFFAYAPYGVATPSAQSVVGQPTFTYHVPQSVAAQHDLLIAAPALDQTYSATQPVQLQFNHVLAGITFAARMDGALTNETRTVKAISIGGLANEATCSSAFVWSALKSTADNTYTVSVADNSLLDKPMNSTTVQELTPANGMMMMVIPQSIADVVTLSVRVARTNTTTGVTQEQTIQGNLRTTTFTELVRAKRYKVTLVLGTGALPTISVSYTLVAWSPENVTIPPFV
ncbi:MAG: fimbrillin family protein [Alistipes sp.]